MTPGLLTTYPGAATGTSTGAANSPKSTMTRPIRMTRLSVLVTTRSVSSGSPRSNTRVSVGMKTMLRVPPRNRRWTKNGSEYAMTNAALTEVAPNIAAITTSRTNPSTRLAIVATAITLAVRANPPAVVAGRAAATGLTLSMSRTL